MLKTILFIIYTALIPLVPLYGARHFKRKKDEIRQIVCWGLFVIQCLISTAAIYTYIQ